MVTNISYNVMIDRLRAFADGHYLIKKFSHGQIDLRYLEQDADYYPWMHVIPGTITPREGLREYSFDITFSDLTRDKEHEAEYIREAISDCTRLAEDLLAEIKNGNTLFDPLVQSVDGSTITPFIHEDTHTLTGVTLSLSIRVPWNWSACDIPADYAPGGSGSGGGAEGGCCVTLQVGGVDNIDQTLLNLIAGSNMTITDNGDGSVTFDSTGGGGGGGELVALEWSADHVSATGNEYQIGDFVWYIGNVYECIATNDSILPTNTSYWTLVGAGNRLRESPTDWNSTSGDNQILNKPTLATVATSGDYNDLTNLPTIPTALNDLSDVNTAGQAADDILTYDGLQWEPITPKNFAAKVSIQDVNDVDIIAPLNNGQVLTWNSTTSQWQNTNPSNSPTGAAGGDLSGNYPNPTVDGIHGIDMQSGTPTSGDVWVYGGSPAKWQHQMLHATQVDNDSAVTGTHVSDALNHLNTTKEPTITAGTTSQYYRGDKTFQTHNIASITDATDVGKNLVKLTNPSAIRYLRINADNTVSAISIEDLKSALQVGGYATITSDFTTTGTSYQDVTGLSFSVTSGKKYMWRATILIQATSGNGMLSVNGPTGTTTFRYTIGTGGTTQIINNGTANNTGTAVSLSTTQRIASGEGVVEPTANGTFTVSVISSVSGAVTIKAGSTITYNEVI